MISLEQFVAGIGFSGLSPEEPGLILLTGSTPDPIPTRADWHLTRFPEDDDLYHRRLEPLCAVPRMATMAIGAIINRIVSSLPAGQQYVNIGVWNGFSLLSGMVGNPDKGCVGVDNFSQFGGPRAAFTERFQNVASENHTFHDLDYRDYFHRVHQGPIGFYLYDGDHEAEHQYEGLRIAEPWFADGCVIMVDDTNTEGPMLGTMRFLEGSSQKYQAIANIRTAHNAHPTFWNGLLLLRKV
ncbi:MAG: class I SAM-dependent methyltransferase [Magnetococcales bacterium]|nr:class I SAM-dependent methyltransferase [Magnetococcales bacterium]